MFDQPASPSCSIQARAAGDADPDDPDDFVLSACPHVDRNDSRCGHRFTLGRLDQAFAVCLGSHHGCPTYHRITNELQHPDIEITVRRVPLASPALTSLELHARLPVSSPNLAEAVPPAPVQRRLFALRRTGT